MNKLHFVALVCLNASLADQLHAEPIETDWSALAEQIEDLDPEKLAQLGQSTTDAMETMLKSDAERADFESETQDLADELGIDMDDF
ncbi:MAG: hypothetical protein AB8B93_17930 [Pseudomonadales bacterium]